MKVATANLYVGSSLDEKKRSIQALIDAGADVIMTQELSEDAAQKALTAWLEPKGWSATKRNSAVTTFWRTAAVASPKEDRIVVNRGGKPWESGAGGNDSIYKIIMILEGVETATGGRFVCLNQHIVPSIDRGGKLDKRKPIRLSEYRRQRDAWVAAMQKYGADGTAVIAGGDVNLAWNTDAGRDLEHAFDTVGGVCIWDEFPDKATHGSRTIDWLIGKNLRWDGCQVINLPGSDHEGVLGTATLNVGEKPDPEPKPEPKLERLHGVDVSSHQPGWQPDPSDAFAFVKATEGTSYRNPERAAQLAAARAKGQIVGHYHWLTPGKPLEQAAYFVQHADIRAGDLLVCDWEKQSDGTHPSIKDVAAFIAEVQRLAPTSKVGLYCNRSDWVTTSVKAGDFLWIAEYGVDKPNTATDWVFWQYTNKPIDRNWCKFTSRADLEKWAKIDRRPPVVQPAPVEPVPPVVPPCPENVGVWAVDPGKVQTVLLGRNAAGKIGRELSPGTTIADGVQFVVNSVGRYALLRSDGWSYDREFLVQVGVGPVPVKGRFPVIPDYNTTERILFRGGRVCRCVAISLPWVEFRMLEEGVIKYNLDLYQLGYRTNVKASAASHARGGNTDCGQYSDVALKIWREMGWAMQRRTVPPFSDGHGHGFPVGCPHLSTSGPANGLSQSRAWDRGRDGLASNGRITGPEPKGRNTPRWDKALSAYLKQVGAPPIQTITA